MKTQHLLTGQPFHFANSSKLPSRTEQQEIVRILKVLFAKEQTAQDLCDQIDQIDTIKKTILGKAFRGELGTNVVGEESAVELLKQVLQGKEK